MAHTQTALTIQEWVATSLEFTLHKSDIVWAKPLLQRIVSEVPHATRNKVGDFIKAQGAYLKPKHSSAPGKCETAFWGVRYRTVPLNSDASQATQHHSTSEVAPPPTLVEWFAKTIALFGMCTNNPTVRGKPHHADTKAEFIFKRVFCDYL